MPTPTHVLIITNNDALRNLFEQIFIIRGSRSVVVSTIQGAKALTERWGLATFRLVIIDTSALGISEEEQQRMACRMLEDWTTKHPILPLLFLGTILQKYAMLAIRAAIVRFVVKPFRLHDLVDAIDNLWPMQDLPQSSAMP